MPVETTEKLEFPIGYGGQDYYLGAVIEADELRSLPYADRAKMVLAAINELGSTGDRPCPADEAFADRAGASQSDRTEVQRVLRAALETNPELGERMQKLLDDIARGNTKTLSHAETIVADLLGDRKSGV